MLARNDVSLLIKNVLHFEQTNSITVKIHKENVILSHFYSYFYVSLTFSLRSKLVFLCNHWGGNIDFSSILITVSLT